MTEVESRPRAAGTSVPRLSRTRLTAMRVDELRRLAVSLGIGNTSTMRKGILVDAIDEQYDNTTDTEAPAAEQTAAEEHAVTDGTRSAGADASEATRRPSRWRSSPRR